MFIRLFLIPFSIFFLFTCSLIAQGTADLRGTIRDAETNEPLVGADVVIAEQGAYTDADGKFVMSLPPGVHTITISFVGYETYTQELNLGPGANPELNLALKPTSTILNTATVTTGKFKKPLGEVTISLEVLKLNLIENTNKTSLDQAIEKVPGVRVIDGQANIRGGSGYSQGAGSRVLLLLDDIPILQADAGFPNWADIPVELIEQVEVLKGAASSLYGSSAMNGIINVQTGYARNEPETKAAVFYTHFFAPQNPALQWWDRAPYIGGAQFSHKQRFGKLDLVAGGYYFNQESFNQSNYLKYGRVALNTRYRFTDRLSAGINVNFNQGGSQNFFYWKDINNLYVGAPNTFSQSNRVRYNVDPHLTYFDKNGNRHKVLGRLYSVDNNLSNERSNQSFQYYGEYQFQRQYTELDLVVTAGVVALGSRVEAELYGDTTFLSRNLAGYLQLDKKLFDRLNLSAGFRYERNYLENPGFTTLGGQVIAPSEEREAKPVFRFGANYQLMDYTYLRASFGQGYRYPTIAEKFIYTDLGGFVVEPSPDLRSESGWSSEIGIKQGFKVSSFEGFLDLSGFIYKYEDMMEFNFTRSKFQTGAPAFSSLNIGGTEIRGYEITLAGRGAIFGLPTTILTGYTYIDPRFDEFDNEFENNDAITQGEINAANSSSDNNILKYRSQHTFKLDLETQWKNLSVGVESFYASHMEAIDAIFELPFVVRGLAAFRQENDRGYHLINFRSAYRFGQHLKVSLLLNNAFNIEYSVRPGLLEGPRNLTARIDWNF